MKKYLMLAVALLFFSTQKTTAQDPIALIIKEGITRVIKAVDLRIQRLQNETIWLQNAQKVIENTLSKVKLDEISGWVEKQRTLYQDYYNELWQVKDIVSHYHRIRDMTQMQGRMLEEYKKAWALFRQDNHFTAEELTYISQVFTGIINESLKGMEQLALVVRSAITQMSDAKRLELITAATLTIETAYTDFKAFNQHNILLSLQRAKSIGEVETIKRLYGIQ